MKTPARQVPALFAEYIGLAKQRKMLEEREAELKKTLAQIVETQGWTDDKGSEYFDFDAPVAGFAGLKRERRVYRTLNEDKAFEVLAAKGITTCTKTVTMVDEEAIEAAFYDEQLTQADIDAMFTDRITYAFKPVK